MKWVLVWNLLKNYCTKFYNIGFILKPFSFLGIMTNLFFSISKLK